MPVASDSSNDEIIDGEMEIEKDELIDPVV